MADLPAGIPVRQALNPRRAGALAVLAALASSFPSPLRAQNPSMSRDFQAIMQWLTHETVQGLAFNAGASFDPPHEIKPWRFQPDISLGLGILPLNKQKFPTLSVEALAARDPAGALPDAVRFPNLTLHLRMGLPGRMDFSVRGANMTIPKGYRLSPSTTGDGQSNTIGFSLRKHLLGGDRPVLTLSANYNHVSGRFNFFNEYKNLELTEGFFVDSVNKGNLTWQVSSLGGNAVLSRTYGVWTPFFGMGYSHLAGSVNGHLRGEYATPLVSPPFGEASERPEEHSARLIAGFQMDLTRLSLFINGEMKAAGIATGKMFTVSTGFQCPFGIGKSSIADRPAPSPRARPSKTSSASGSRTPAPRALFRIQAPPRPIAREDDLPEMIFIQ